MKKRILALISLIMSVVIGIACLSGCNLVTKDMEKDMNQTIATVDIEYKENILKKELVLEYINVGYIYVQYYGYTPQRTFELLLDGLIQNRIMIQYAMKSFEEDASFTKDTQKAVNTPERYLSEEEITDAVYQTRKAVNDMLDSYSKADDEAEVQDAIFGESRTVPTGASNVDKELTLADKQEYNRKPFDINSSDKRRKGFDSFIKLIKDNGLLGSAYNGEIEETEYYKNTLKSAYESKVISAYEESVKKQVRESVTFDMLKEVYTEKYNEQKAWSNSQFASGLKDATAESPLLYSSFGKYGYVYNLLLGASEKQSEDITKIREDNKNISTADYNTARKEILDETIATDLRSSWILSDYYGSIKDGKFVFDNESGYSFAKDPKNSLPFNGKVREIKPATDDARALYTVESVDKLGLEDFMKLVDEYLDAGTSSDSSAKYASLGDAVYSAYNKGEVEEYDAKVKDLIFAFSTDSGSLTKLNGYDIAPEVDGNDSEEYVKTFGEAGRILLEQGQGYVVVASDYGYHVLFFSEIIDGDFGYDNLVAYLNEVMGEAKTELQWKTDYENQLKDYEKFAKTNSYLYLLANSVIETKVSNALSESRTSIVNKYRYEETNHVTIYSDRYADLLD